MKKGGISLETGVSQIRHVFAVTMAVLCFAWMIFPMLILQGRYCFIVHDGMDSYAGLVQYIHDNHLYFRLNQNLPIMNGIEWKYTFIGFTLYDFYNCVFGYVVGQTLTRITGCVLGFFSLKHLVAYIYPERTPFFNDMVLLIASVYIVTPVSPLRTIAFASLPIVIETFLRLRNRDKFTRWCFISAVFPILSVFDGVFLFVLGFWFLFLIIDAIAKKRINKNLCIAFITMCFMTIIVNYNFFLVALSAGETTRGLYVDGKTEFVFNKELFKSFLYDGQYHATAYPRRYLWPLNAIMSLLIFGMILENKEILKRELSSIVILCFGWILCFVGPLIMAAQQSGFKVGFLLIDGFQWGRVIALTTLSWPLMVVASIYIMRDKKIFGIVFFVVICLQLTYVARVNSEYNDTWTTIRNEMSYKSTGVRPYITYDEFASKKVFEDIKEDIGYNGQGVAAYGYHPAVLLLNNFNTIDGYFSVHSMKWQNQFREIIEPALDHLEVYKNYYDTWGGRMYLFAPIGFEPIKEKYQDPMVIYINAEAFKKYGGEYVLSIVELSNAEEQGLEYVNDYDSGDSIYHIWLYKAK